MGAGVIMVAMGIAMATGQLTALSYWMLRFFPALGRIGCRAVGATYREKGAMS